MVHNTIKYDDPLAFIKAKVEGVIVEKRYEKIIDQLFIKEELPAIKMASISSEGFNSSIFTISTNNSDEQSVVTKKGNLKPINDQEPSDNNDSIFFVKNIFNNRNIKQALNVQNILQLSSSILRHFLNNVITNFSILPTSVIPQDLFHGSRSQQFWGSYDPNLYEGINIFVVVTNLFIIATGIFAAINYQKFIGILPLVVGVGYNLSNAIAISSGNRYSQPTSWIVLFYYVLGLITISQWFLHLIRNQQPRKLGVHQSITRTFSFKTRRIYSTFSIVFILFIGSIPVMADIVPPVRFLEFRDEEIISAIFNNSDCKAALTSIGRILYPVQVNQEEYEIIYGKSEINNDSTMMTFIFLSPENSYEQRMIFYPDDSLIGLKHRADVLIIGKGSEALLIGVIDSVYASKIVTYESLSNLPINCYMSANK
jgi:hypothetical protein